jgi:peptidyl-prolyl cis-trans isomerase SurA
MKLARQRRRPRPLGETLAVALSLAATGAAVLAPHARVHAESATWKPTVHDANPGATKKAKRHVKPASPATAAMATPGDEKHAASSSQSIVALVNDDPITGYEVEQRVTLALMGTPELQQRLQAKLKSPKINDQFKAFAIKRLKANPPKSEAEQQSRIKQLQAQFVQSIREDVVREFRPVARKKALDELIDERLKLQEAKKLDVVASNDDVDRILTGMAERNKMSLPDFTEHISKMGADVSAMRERIKASLSWADVIRRRYGQQIVVATRDVDHLVSGIEGQDNVELRVSRILLTVAEDDQKRVAQRLTEGERLRREYSGCATMSALANGVAGARFDDLGDRKPSSLPEPTRSLLLNAHDGEMLPPTIGEAGVELWAVCGRKAVKVDEKREMAEGDLRQKEFEILAKKHLKDLRQDAHIEYR